MYHNPPGSSKQEYWSRLPLPSPGDFADLTIEPSCPKCKQILYCLSHQGLGLVLTLYTQAWNTNRGNLKIFCSSNHFYTALEKAMAPHSTTLGWKIPWTEQPRRLQSMGSLRVGHDWATSLSLFTFMHWRRKWQPTPVFLPGESQGRGSLVGCRLWGRTESDTTEV